MAINLSKSKYLSGLQCEKRLWLEINDPDKATPLSETQKLIFDRGAEVGILAREQFPGGFLIELDLLNLDNCLAETEKVIHKGETIIYEGTFYFDDTIAIADILNKNRDGSWDLIEVKSTTDVKAVHIPDLALQRYVLEGTGLKINKTLLMHIDKECVYPDLSNLFIIEDLTSEINTQVKLIPSDLEAFKKVIIQNSEPQIPIGPQCKNPYECPFKDYCWTNYGSETVFDIPRLATPKQLELRAKQIVAIDQLPVDYPLSDNQRSYVERILNHKIEIDRKGIEEKLSDLDYPLYFLDFETDNPPIPRFKGMKPYQHIPFQYSCHKLNKNGKLEHFEYLHTDQNDPRFPIIKSLFKSIGNTGSVIVYYSRFEREILNNLGATFPEFSEELKSISDRLWDQLDIFRDYYKHYAFGNSNSLKRVLPVVVPEMNYDELAIKQGDEAQMVWNKMSRLKQGPEREKMINDLKTYCKMDTLAMVEIRKILQIMTRLANSV